MTKILAAVAVLLLLLANRASATGIQESTDTFGPFGTLHIYMGSEHPRHVALLVSGDGGWNLGVIDMARALAELDSMVVGIDITRYIKQLNAGSEKCVYPAAHFEALSQYLQKKYRFPRYTLPVLVGYSSGATMVYATLAQSPPNTFAGGIGMGFCPDLKTAKPLCRGSGALTSKPDRKLGFVYNPAPALASKLYVLQGDIDRVCSTPATMKFLSHVGSAESIELPGVGHGFSVQKNWMPQFKQAFQKITESQQPPTSPARPADELAGLPLVVLPAQGKSDTLAVIVSGDGGWAGIDKQIAETLNKDGIAVIGLNSLQYFWEKKDPEIAGRDLARILSHYGQAWDAEKFILVGYSSGADVLPFMTSRLQPALKSRVRVVALVGLGEDASFEFHVSDWVFNTGGTRKIAPEIQKLKGMKVLCVYGEDETASGCLLLNRSDVNVIEMKGGHHFGGDYEKLARIIVGHSK